MKDKIRTRGTDRGAKKERRFPQLASRLVPIPKIAECAATRGRRGSRPWLDKRQRERTPVASRHEQKKKKKTRGAQIPLHLSFLSKRAISARFAPHG